MSNSGISCKRPQCENTALDGCWLWFERGKRRMQAAILCATHGNAIDGVRHVPYRPNFLEKPPAPQKEQPMPGNHFSTHYSDWNADGTRYVTNIGKKPFVVVHKDSTREVLKPKQSTAVRKTAILQPLTDDELKQLTTK